MLSPKISLVETDRIRICWQILLSLLTISVKKKGGGVQALLMLDDFYLGIMKSRLTCCWQCLFRFACPKLCFNQAGKKSDEC